MSYGENPPLPSGNRPLKQDWPADSLPDDEVRVLTDEEVELFLSERPRSPLETGPMAGEPEAHRQSGVAQLVAILERMEADGNAARAWGSNLRCDSETMTKINEAIRVVRSAQRHIKESEQ